jgi:hypothetical protein
VKEKMSLHGLLGQFLLVSRVTNIVWVFFNETRLVFMALITFGDFSFGYGVLALGIIILIFLFSLWLGYFLEFLVLPLIVIGVFLVVFLVLAFWPLDVAKPTDYIVCLYFPTNSQFHMFMLSFSVA